MNISSVAYASLPPGVLAIAEDGNGDYIIYINANLDKRTRTLVLEQICKTHDNDEENIHVL